jgi:hypothetical protein
MVAALVPQHLMGFILGMWFLTQAAAFLLGGYVATFTAVPENITDPLQTLPVYTDVFSKIGLVTLGVTVVMAIMVPWLNRMINTPARKHGAVAGFSGSGVSPDRTNRSRAGATRRPEGRDASCLPLRLNRRSGIDIKPVAFGHHRVRRRDIRQRRRVVRALNHHPFGRQLTRRRQQTIGV